MFEIQLSVPSSTNPTMAMSTSRPISTGEANSHAIDLMVAHRVCACDAGKCWPNISRPYAMVGTRYISSMISQRPSARSTPINAPRTRPPG